MQSGSTPPNRASKYCLLFLSSAVRMARRVRPATARHESRIVRTARPQADELARWPIQQARFGVDWVAFLCVANDPRASFYEEILRREVVYLHLTGVVGS